MATYTPGIPLATDKPRNTQPVLRENIDAIPELLVVDHIGFNVPNKGKHNRVTMPHVTGGIPAPPLNELTVYSNAGVSSGRTELFYKRDGSATVLNITERKAADATDVGWTYLPSGIKMVWGRNEITAPPPFSVTVAFNSVAGFPGFTNPLNPGVIVCGEGTAGVARSVVIIQVLTTQVSIGSTAAGFVRWLAIGI